MVKSLIISLILTILIEILISVFFGIRKRKDIIVIIAVNTLTNPVVVFIANILNIFKIIWLYWVVVIIMEVLVVFVEKTVYEKVLNYKKISGVKLSIINNVISFGLGLIITFVFNFNAGLKVEVASAFFPLAQEILNSQDLKYSVQMTSTDEVYKDIISGKTDVIIASAPSDEQKEMIKKSNVNLEFKTLYLEPLAILVNKNNSVDDLSIEQIQEIYFENFSDWNTYQLEKNNGSQTCFESIVKDNKLSYNHYEIKTMPEIIDKIALDEKAIGYSFYSYCSKTYINNNIKIISVNNKEIGDENYPLLFEVFLIYRKDNNNNNILKIVEWLETGNSNQFIDKIKLK